MLRLRRKSARTETTATPEEREWTFMVYLAGDNDLESYGQADLLELKEVGSDARVAFVAQFDRRQQGSTQRYYLRQGTPLEQDVVDGGLGETNTGDPRELVRFVYWAAEHYPARRHALVLWNHGVGWKEDDIYHLIQQNALQRGAKVAPSRPEHADPCCVK